MTGTLRGVSNKHCLLSFFSLAFSDMKFENNGHIHVYSPGAGADNLLVSIFFHKHNYSVNFIICCSPIQM